MFLVCSWLKISNLREAKKAAANERRARRVLCEQKSATDVSLADIVNQMDSIPGCGDPVEVAPARPPVC